MTTRLELKDFVWVIAKKNGHLDNNIYCIHSVIKKNTMFRRVQKPQPQVCPLVSTAKIVETELTELTVLTVLTVQVFVGVSYAFDVVSGQYTLHLIYHALIYMSSFHIRSLHIDIQQFPMGDLHIKPLRV